LFQSGGAQAFPTVGNYWSSSQYTINTGEAWLQFFSSGFQLVNGKNNFDYARAIRRVAISGVGSTQTLSITAANTDGFAVGQKIAGSSSGATGTITAINGTSVTITQTSATNFTTTDKIQGAGTAITGNPLSVTAAPFTTANVPQSSLAVNSTYYARVQYATTNASAATSSFSAWSSFATAASFLPTPGAALGGGYFGGQILDGTVYNLIVAPVTSGALNGQNGGASPSAIQYKTSASADVPSATVQNQVYGGLTTDLFKARAAHPVFSTFINGATGPNAGAFNLATGGAGGGTGIGGFNDWYLPAVNEIEILYFNLKPSTAINNSGQGINPNAVPARASGYNGSGPPAVGPAQTTSALFQDGGAQAFTTANAYVTSSEFSGDPQYVERKQFDDGGLINTNKNGSVYARAVRRISA
jgi:hypothetical protein